MTPLAVAAGIGWVEGVTYEWSDKESVEAVKMLLDLGLDPNATSDEGRAPLHGAAHEGRNEVVQMLVDAGTKFDQLDFGSRASNGGGYNRSLVICTESFSFSLQMNSIS